MDKLLKWNMLAVLAGLLIGCGGAPTFDGTSQETADASRQAMYPDIDLDNKDKADFGPPPALDAYACYTMGAAFGGIEIGGKKVGGFGASDDDMEQVAKYIRDSFDGMTADEMVAFAEQEGVELGCLDKMR